MRRIKDIILTASLLLASTSLSAQTDSTSTDDMQAPVRQQRLLTSKIHLKVRTYGDRVALRWLPEDFVSWQFLAWSGVNVLRVDKETGEMTTVASALKPLSQQQFEQKYALQTDSLAAVCAGVLYGDGGLKANQTREKPGSQGANVELNNEQDLSFGYAMMVAEWRPDLAEAMAVGLTDRSVRRGHVYDYYVQPSTTDFGGKIIFEPGVSEGVKNEAYKPLPYDPKLSYEQVSPRRVGVSWIDLTHSSYEIERREVSPHGSDWQRLNDKPYLSMVQDSDIEGLCIYNDSVGHEGTWEYRIRAYEPFGTLTEPSPVLTAYVRDIEAPRAPQLTRIVLERPDDDPTSKILAHVHWQVNDTLEHDLQGYMIHYYNERLTGNQWMPLTATAGGDLIAPADTTAVVDVTGLRTGMLCIMAYDDSGNTGKSLPQLIHITDYQAPAPPDSLKALVLPDGYVILSWRPSPKDLDIAYYDLAFANDSTHEFLILNKGGLTSPMYVDTLALDANQKYVYYKVRAVDTESNFGDWSPILQVTRPHDSAPSVAHLDESWHHQEQGMHMRWVVGTDADMAYHLLLRRLGDDGEWEPIARWDADSIRAAGQYAVVVDDNPPYHQDKRYYYMVESHNSTPYISNSLAVSWLHNGPRILNIPIKAAGAWIEHEGLVRLTWDAQVGNAFAGQEYYYCVFRKLPGDKRFQYVVNVAKDEMEYTDRKLSKGQEAEYYVVLRFKDGRESQPSNVVKVKRAKE